MNPALTAILDAIESGTVRIRWAHDDEHALTEAQAMAADVRSLLVLLADTAHTEADPLPDPYEVAERMAVPRRNCSTCSHDYTDDDDTECCGRLGGEDPEHEAIRGWCNLNFSDSRTCADNCPGYTLRLPTTGDRITAGK